MTPRSKHGRPVSRLSLRYPRAAESSAGEEGEVAEHADAAPALRGPQEQGTPAEGDGIAPESHGSARESTLDASDGEWGRGRGGGEDGDTDGVEAARRRCTQSAYRLHLVEDIIGSLPGPLRAALSAEETRILDSIRGELSAPAQGVLMRLLQRQGPWYSLDSLFAWDEVVCDPIGAALAVEELTASQVLLSFRDLRVTRSSGPVGQVATIDGAVEAAANLLRAAELRAVRDQCAIRQRHRPQGNRRPRSSPSAAAPASAAASDGVASLQQDLRLALQRQPTLFGAPPPLVARSVDALAARVRAKALARGVELPERATREELAPRLPPCAHGLFSRQGGQSERAGRRRVHLSAVAAFRLTPAAAAALRRAVLLHTLSANTTALSSGWAGGSPWGGAAGRTQSPGLLARFRVMRFAPVQCRVTTPPFPSRRHFLCYDVAALLRRAFDAAAGAEEEAARAGRRAAAQAEKAAAQASGKEPSPKSPSAKGAAAGGPSEEVAALVRQVAQSTSILAAAELECSSCSNGGIRRAWARVWAALHEPGRAETLGDRLFGAPATAGGDQVAQGETDGLAAAAEAEVADAGSAAELALLGLAWLARACGSASATVTLESVVAAESGSCSSSPLPAPGSLSGAWARAGLPAFLRQFDPGWTLASVAWEAVGVLERASLPASAAVALLLLLQLPFTPHRRGRWWARLCVHLERGLGMPSAALRASLAGFADPDVAEGGLMALRDRAERLGRTRKRHVAPLVRQASETRVRRLRGEEGVATATVEGGAPEPTQDDAEMAAAASSGVAGQPAGASDSVVTVHSGEREEEDRLCAALQQHERPSGRVLRVRVYGRPLNRTTGERSRFIGYDDSTVSVEGLVLQLYARNGGWNGSHCEGSLLRGLFPIFMWRVLFADVPHAFVCPYQDAPLDLDSRGAFLRARSALAQEVLAGIRTMSRGELVQTIRDAYREKSGTVVRAAPWRQMTWRAAALVACSVGPRALAAVCEAMCADFKHMSGGMPDLLLWRVWRPDTGEAVPVEVERDEEGRLDAPALPDPADPALCWAARAVEVKGPRDRLADKQRAWLSTLAAAGVPSDVCQVKESPQGRAVAQLWLPATT